MGVTLRAVDPCNVRLACSGLLDERAGSVAGAGYLLVRELLARGIDIDFYAENGYTPMPESLAGPRFNYVGIERPRWMSLMSPRAFFLILWLFAPVVQRSWENLFGSVARERHRAAPYDAVLSLGAALRFTIPGVPTVSWLQGAPRTEQQRFEGCGRRSSPTAASWITTRWWRITFRDASTIGVCCHLQTL